MTEPTPYLLYLGPARPSEASSAARIARLVADHATVNLPGTYRMTELSQAAELANQDGAAVTDGEGKPVLYVVDVPYRGALKLDETGEPKDRRSLALGLAESMRLLTLGGVRLSQAWKSNEAKSRRAKWQLAIGLMFVVVLAVVAVLGALALVAAVWPDVLPEWTTSEEAGPRVVIGFLGFTATAGSIYASVRRRSSVFGRVAQGLLRYVENPQARKEAARALENAIDRLDELTEDGRPRPRFHVLGYSFGGLVAVDALCQPAGAPRGRRLDLVASLATVGCPADFVRLYYPDYFDDRVPLPATVPWHNVFLANDVLGSNFLQSDETDGATAPEPGRASRPEGLLQPTRNFVFGSSELTWVELLRREGFRLHTRYWSDDLRTSIIDVLMSLWPPMSEDRPHDQVAAPG